MGKKNEPFKFGAVFPVKSGENSLTVRIVSMAKHYRFQFDRIALFKTDAHPENYLPYWNINSVLLTVFTTRGTR